MNPRSKEMERVESARMGPAVDGKHRQPKEPHAQPDVIAEVLRELETHLEDGRPPTLWHPLVTCVGYNRNHTGLCERLVEQYLENKEALFRAIVCEDWLTAVMLYEQPWRIEALLAFEERMTDAEYGQCLRFAWTMNDNVSQYGDIMQRIFAPEGRTTEMPRLVMTEAERAVYDGLRDVVEVFRGCGSANRAGWSWTTQHDQANWFACRWMGINREQFSGLLLTGRCSKKDIIAYLDSRDEAEIVIDPDDVEIMRSVTVEPLTKPVGGGKVRGR